MRHWLRAALLSFSLFAAGAQADEPVRIVHLNSQTGPLAADGAELARGLRLGFEFASEGRMTLGGRPLELIEYDDRLDPERARELVRRAYLEDRAELVIGPLASGVALAVLPIAAQYQRPLLPQGRLDALTAPAWQPFVTRIGPSVAQEASASALAIGAPAVCVATLAPDYQVGRAAIGTFARTLTSVGGQLVREEYQPLDDPALEPAAERLLDALLAVPGCEARFVFLFWPEGAVPLAAFEAERLSEHGIRFALSGRDLPRAPRVAVAVEGASYYAYRLADSRANDWLVVEHLKRYNAVPGAYVVQGFNEALAVAAAAERAGGAEAAQLLRGLAGLRFEGAGGEVYVRPQDRQALQPYFHYRRAPGSGRIESLRRLPPQRIPVPLSR